MMMRSRVRLFVNGLLVLALIGALWLVGIGWHELPMARVWGGLLIGAGLAGAVGIGVMFFLPWELRANLTLMGAVTLLSLWVASWILYEPPQSRADARQSAFEDAARAAGAPFDTRSWAGVTMELRDSGVDAYPTISTWALFRGESPNETWVSVLPDAAAEEQAVLPLAGPSRKTTVACNEQGEYLIVDTDRYGYNNPDHVYTAESPALILGDSFAFGFCVRPNHDIGNQLRARGREVVNFGYPGTGPLTQLAQLREYGRLIQPSAILWLYFQGNDLTNLAREYSEPRLRRYLEADYHQGLAARQTEVDAFWAEHMDWAALRAQIGSPPLPLGHILLLQPLRARLAGHGLAAQSEPRGEASIEVFEETLDAMVAEARALAAPLYFVFLPGSSRFALERGRDNRDEVLAAVQARGLTVIDFEARMLEAEDPLQYFPFRAPEGHYTEAGYALLAEHILDHLH